MLDLSHLGGERMVIKKKAVIIIVGTLVIFFSNFSSAFASPKGVVKKYLNLIDKRKLYEARGLMSKNLRAERNRFITDEQLKLLEKSDKAFKKVFGTYPSEVQMKIKIKSIKEISSSKGMVKIRADYKVIFVTLGGSREYYAIFTLIKEGLFTWKIDNIETNDPNLLI